MSKHSKSMNILDVIMIAFGAMIGWGWVISSGEWIQNAGVLGTALGFCIGGIMIYSVGLVYSELTTAMPENGGIYRFCYRAFGPECAFASTWILILSYIGVVCFEACSFATVLQYLFPGFLQGYLYTVGEFDIYASWLAAAMLSAVFITVVNIRGIKSAAALQTVLTLMIGATGILLVAGSAFGGHYTNMIPQMLAGDTFREQTRRVMSVAGVAPFFLFGFDVIPQAAGEINVPLKKLGRVLLLSIVMAVSFYALVVLAIGYVLPADRIAEAFSGSGLVAAEAMAVAFRSELMAKVMILGGVCGIITSWNSFLIGGSRALSTLAQERMLPRLFSVQHSRYHTPVGSLIFIGVLSVLSPLFGRAMLTWVANAASFVCCLAYLMVALSFLKLRSCAPEMKRPFRVAHGEFAGLAAVCISGFMAALYLLPGTGSTLNAEETGIVLGWAVLGAAFQWKRRIRRK